MINPWLKLTSESQYILEVDKKEVLAFAGRQKENAKLELNSIPEPFIGNPETARVVLLLLNPGHKKEDSEAHKKLDFKKALFQNLRGQAQPYPFYPLNPAFSCTPSAKWWTPRTRELKEASNLSMEVLSERLFAIEWFPYHSISSGLPTSLVCESQKYTVELVKKMIAKNVLIVRMRSVNHWSKVDERLRKVPALRNPRCSYISRRNAGAELFEMIVSALK
jgi:hypothetical protein